MKFLLIPLSCILSGTKVLIQGKFAKDKAKTASDALLFNGLIFGVGALIFIPLFGLNVSFSALIAGVIVGVFNLVFQMAYVFAFSCGPVSLTSMITAMGMLVPILVSSFFYDEPLTPNRIIGIAITVLALYFAAEKPEKGHISLKWMLFTLIAFLGNCGVLVTQKIYTKSFASGDTSSFVAVHFAFSAIMSFLIYAILLSKGKGCSYKVGKSVILTATLIGVILGGYHLVYTYALSVIDATVLLPLYSGGHTVFVTVGSALLMKERLNRRQILSIILGVIAIALMSI